MSDKPHYPEGSRAISAALNELERLRTENERLRVGWDEAQTFMALALEREERLRAALTELIDNTRPESRMSDLRSARLNAQAALCQT